MVDGCRLAYRARRRLKTKTAADNCAADDLIYCSPKLLNYFLFWYNIKAVMFP